MFKSNHRARRDVAPGVAGALRRLRAAFGSSHCGLAVAVAAGALLAACGGGGEPPGLLEIRNSSHLHSVITYDNLGQAEWLSTGELEPPTHVTVDLGATPMHPTGADDRATGEVFVSADAETFWAQTEAPAGNPTRTGEAIGSAAFYAQSRAYVKLTDDARIEFEITDAVIELLDGHPDVPVLGNCPYYYVQTNDLSRCPDDLHAEIYVDIRVDAIDGPSDTTVGRSTIMAGLHGVLSFTGRNGKWDGWRVHSIYDDLSPGRDGLDAVVYRPLWQRGDFTFTTAPASGGLPASAMAELREDSLLAVPRLDLVPIGSMFMVSVSVNTRAINRRGGEAYVKARLRDPVKTFGSALRVTGAQPVAPPATPPVVVPPPPLPACTAGPDPEAGALDFERAQFRLFEFDIVRPEIFIQRTGGSRGAVGVRLRTVDGGTAQAGVHYKPIDRVVYFGDGDDLPRAIRLETINDAEVNDDRTVMLELSEPQGCASLGSQATAQVAITDDDSRPGTFTVGGTITGLRGTGLVIANQPDELSPTADGPFTFPTGWPGNARYNVRIVSQPVNPSQSCGVSNGSGSLNGSSVDNVVITCADLPPPAVSLDRTFGNEGKVYVEGLGANAALLQPDGKIVTVGGRTVGRFLPDGTPDPSFGSGGRVTVTLSGSTNGALQAVALQPDGKIVLAGYVNVTGHDDFAVARLHADGRVDTSFAGVGSTRMDFFSSTDRASVVLVHPDGRIFVAGQATVANPKPGQQTAMALYTPDGQLDPGFGTLGTVTRDFATMEIVTGGALMPDGRIVLAVRVADSIGGEKEDAGLVRVLPNGELDPSFGSGGFVRQALQVDEVSGEEEFGDSEVLGGLALLPDGGVAVVSSTRPPGVGSITAMSVGQFRSSGILEPAFGLRGVARTTMTILDDYALAVARQSDGKLVVVGQAGNIAPNPDFAVARFLPDGQLDTSFDGDGHLPIDFFGGDDRAQVVLIQPDGKILVLGSVFNGTRSGLGMVRITP